MSGNEEENEVKNERWRSKLGEFLKDNNENNHETSQSLNNNNKIVLLYFSASWCPPCQQFTPILVKFYEAVKQKAQKNGEDVEVVWISWDRVKDAHDEYFKKMPWKALPFGSPLIKQLSLHYAVEGIPSLVVLDSDASIITHDGRTKVIRDREGNEFPWRAKPLSALFNPTLLNKNKVTVNADVIKGKHVCVIIGGKWVGQRWITFCNRLSTLSRNLKTSGKELEIVWASVDKNMRDFNEMLQIIPQPSYAFPFNDPRLDDFISSLNLSKDLPKVVILGEDGKIINENAFSLISNDPSGEYYPWAEAEKFKVNKLSLASNLDLNSSRSIIAFVEKGSKLEREENEGLKRYIMRAEEYILLQAGSHGVLKEIKFFYSNGDEPQAAFLLKTLNPSFPSLLYLHAPNYYFFFNNNNNNDNNGNDNSNNNNDNNNDNNNNNNGNVIDQFIDVIELLTYILTDATFDSLPFKSL